MPVQIGELLGVDHARTAPAGEELDHHKRERQPAGIEPDAVAEDDATRVYDIEEDLLDLLNAPVGIDDLMRLMPERQEVQAVLGGVLGVAVGPPALGLWVGQAWNTVSGGAANSGSMTKSVCVLGMCFIARTGLSAPPSRRRAGRTVR